MRNYSGEDDSDGYGFIIISSSIFVVIVTLIFGFVFKEWYKLLESWFLLLGFYAFMLFFRFLEIVPSKLKRLYVAFGVIIILWVASVFAIFVIFPKGDPAEIEDEYDDYDYYEEDDISADNDMYYISIPQAEESNR